ncbi:hypothetical protein Csa_019118 [Cucumis sativus]|uniref:Uncharacterized protein n=1 Tax=Cucumis sativus TaxID=3659 RepID=A0A0A0KZS1_CUCSA|nr:hypothetical protein Csa_019118 [Cucumis sativus]
MVNEVFSHGAVEIASLDETNVFKIYRQRLKAYYDDENHIKVFVDLKVAYLVPTKEKPREAMCKV